LSKFFSTPPCREIKNGENRAGTRHKGEREGRKEGGREGGREGGGREGGREGGKEGGREVYADGWTGKRQKEGRRGEG
jgi:hypothetical protein